MSPQQSADYDAPEPVSENVLDREGDWEIRTTIYRNGRRVATCDQIGANFDDTVYDMTTNLERHEVQMHQPRRRTRVIPPAESGGAS